MNYTTRVVMAVVCGLHAVVFGSRSRSLTLCRGSIFLAAVALLCVEVTTAADYAVTETTWGDAVTAGSFAWAIDQVNSSTDATNSITLSSGLQVNVDTADQNVDFNYIAQLLKPVTINGNGGTLVGNPFWINRFSGALYDKTNPARYDATLGDLFIDAKSFLVVGALSTGTPGLQVSINNLNFNGLNRIAKIEPGSALSVTGGTMSQLVNFTSGDTVTPGFEVLEGSLNVSNATVTSAYALQQIAFPTGYISNYKGTVNVSDSTMSYLATSGAVVTTGGTTNIVSSVMNDAGGVYSYSASGPVAGVTNMSNSVLMMYGSLASGNDANIPFNRLEAGPSATLNVEASTVTADLFSMGSETLEQNGIPLFADGGTINLESTAILASTDELLHPTQTAFVAQNGGSITADAYSWMSPTPTQSAADLQTLTGQPSLLTGSPALPLSVFSTTPLVEQPLAYPTGTYPVAGGVLVDVVPNADGANQLLNPIDSSPILVDVYGNPRTTLGSRNVGAVEAVPEPSSLALLIGGVASAATAVFRRRGRR
ncbi:MAG: hypothetical protein RLZZ440_653 [Planctomycetota bacterium]